MATKVSNYHIETIMNNSKSYNIFDIYIALAHISSEVDGKFIIQTFSDNKADLINLANKYVNLSYRTIHNNITELTELDILEYKPELSAWILVDMEKMVQSVNEAPSVNERNKFMGFTTIREFFITSEFHEMKSSEKRCLVYMAQLCDSKASMVYNEFVMNLYKSNSSWFKVLKTKSKYYARTTITKMLNRYNNMFINKSDELREKDIAPKSISLFKFSFSCSAISKKEDDNTQYDLVKLLNAKEFELVKQKITFSNITLTKKQIMHIVRAISNIKQWHIKERVAQIIVNKYVAIQIHKSRENIKSLPAYLVGVVKAVVTEYMEFKNHITTMKQDNTFDDLSIDLDNYKYNNITSILSTI